jgi:Fe2+ transport system protein B
VQQRVTGIWLYQNVVPNLLMRFARDSRFLMVMALAKLWAVFDDSACKELPLQEVGRIRDAYHRVYGQIDGNSVTKVRLRVLNVDGRLQVVVATRNSNVEVKNEENEEQQQQQQLQQQGTGEAMALSEHHHQEVLQRLDMLQAEQQAMRQWMQHMFDRVVTNQRRIAVIRYAMLLFVLFFKL